MAFVPVRFYSKQNKHTFWTLPITKDTTIKDARDSIASRLAVDPSDYCITITSSGTNQIITITTRVQLEFSIRWISIGSIILLLGSLFGAVLSYGKLRVCC